PDLPRVTKSVAVLGRAISGRPPVTASVPAASPVFMNSRLVKSAIWLLREARPGHMLPSPQLKPDHSDFPGATNRNSARALGVWAHAASPAAPARSCSPT